MKTKKNKPSIDSGTEGGDLPAGLSKPAQRAFASAGYTRLDQFTQVTEAEVLRLHGVGPDAIKKLRVALAAKQKSFAEPG